MRPSRVTSRLGASGATTFTGCPETIFTGTFGEPSDVLVIGSAVIFMP
jgi:hypothetical protein